MAKKSEVAPEVASEEVLEVEVKAEAETKAAPKAKGVATVVWLGNTRVYSKEDHGDDYLKLAKEFAEKKGGEVV